MKILISKTLISLRKSHRLTQDELACFLYVSRPTYSRYEADQLEMTITQFFSLSKLYNIKIEDLIDLILKENRHQEWVNSQLNPKGQELLLLIKEYLRTLNVQMSAGA